MEPGGGFMKGPTCLKPWPQHNGKSTTMILECHCSISGQMTIKLLTSPCSSPVLRCRLTVGEVKDARWDLNPKLGRFVDGCWPQDYVKILIRDIILKITQRGTEIPNYKPSELNLRQSIIGMLNIRNMHIVKGRGVSNGFTASKPNV